MSISDWINKIFGYNNTNSTINIPTEFQIPNENINAKKHNFEHGNSADFFETTNPFEESINIFHSSIEDMFRQFGIEFPTGNEDYNNLNIFIDDNFSRTPNEEENNRIPKKNFIARNYFLKPNPPPRKMNENPVQIIMSPRLHGQSSSSSRSYVSAKLDGRVVEKEVSTKQLQGGITEKVIVLKDGNQKCITTITENLKTGEQNCNKQLINLDESQLNEFENRFSKF